MKAISRYAPQSHEMMLCSYDFMRCPYGGGLFDSCDSLYLQNPLVILYHSATGHYQTTLLNPPSRLCRDSRLESRFSQELRPLTSACVELIAFSSMYQSL